MSFSDYWWDLGCLCFSRRASVSVDYCAHLSPCFLRGPWCPVPLPCSGSTKAYPRWPLPTPHVCRLSCTAARVLGMDVFNFHVVRFINSFLSGSFRPGCPVTTVPFPADKPGGAPPAAAYVEASSVSGMPSGSAAGGLLAGAPLSEVEHIRLLLRWKCPVLHAGCWFCWTVGRIPRAPHVTPARAGTKAHLLAETRIRERLPCCEPHWFLGVSSRFA